MEASISRLRLSDILTFCVLALLCLGVVMVRAVRERRREVGVLRALGFNSVSVRRAFLAESSFIALEGILIGVVLALITAWRLVNSGSFGTGVAFTIPWVQIVVLVVVSAMTQPRAATGDSREAGGALR